MKIRSFSSVVGEDRSGYVSPSGSRLRKQYQKSIEADGTPTIIEAGVEDVYDSIQKAAQGITLDDLIRRAQAGDTSAIPDPVDSYVDLTHMPSDMLEAHTMLSAARIKYDALPAEIKSKFGNTFEAFLQASADGSVFSVLSASPTPSADALTAEEIAKIRSTIGGNDNA